MPTTKVPLKRIRIDGGTQQRPLSADALDRYEDRRRGGEEFPPLSAVADGQDYWLWDGFHRYHVAAKVGDEALLVTWTQGKQRDAIWLSFGANKDNGEPRPKGAAAEIIRAILTDVEWSRTSQGEIARHVGVSPQYVSKVRASINQLIDAPAEKLVSRGGKAYVQNTANIGKAKPSPATDPPPNPDDIPLDLPAKPNGATAGAGGAPAGEVVTDQTGRPIQGTVADAFRRRQEIQDLMTTVSKVKTTVLKAIEAKDLLFADINPSRFEAECNNAYHQLKAALPYAACPYCRAAGCKACHGRGWINEGVYERAPKELKAP